MNKKYNFNKSLKKAQRDQDLPFWRPVYIDLFGEGITIVKHSKDGEHQKAGIDRSIIMPDGHQFLIEEKLDWYTTKNMFIEHWSSFEDRQPGWIEKPLRCDFLIYAFPLLGQAFKFDFLLLQKAWFENKQRWLNQYGEKKVVNDIGHRSWTTKGVAVPVQEVFEQYKQQHKVRFEKVNNN